MFFERLKVACVQKGTSPTTLLKKLGMSTSSACPHREGQARRGQGCSPDYE